MPSHKTRRPSSPTSSEPSPHTSGAQGASHGNAGEVEKVKAAQGVAAGGSQLPFLDSLSKAFGGHDLSGVNAHTGAHTAEACQTMGANAYAVGNDVAFGSGAPDLWTTAHEAAHVIQQRAGIGVSGGVGSVGDAGERQANEVADRVVSGQTAGDILPSVADAQGKSSTTAVQFYKEEKGTSGEDLRVSDDGKMVVEQDVGEDYNGNGVPDWHFGSHNFWSEVGPDHWNDSLAEKESVIRFNEGGQDAPNTGGAGSRILSENTDTKTSGDAMQLWADCGRSGRDVMGAGKGTGGGKMTAVYNKEVPAGLWDKFTHYQETGEWDDALKVMEERETAASGPGAMKNEILSDVLGLPAPEALAQYEGMSDDERIAFDAKTGINQYARPEVGEGFTMSSHGDQIKAVTDEDKGKDNNGDGYVDMWNFHWGGVVATSGTDRVSLENYAVGDPSVKNTDWEHQMYGDTPGQTFHDYHKGTNQHGTMPFTFRVRERDGE